MKAIRNIYSTIVSKENLYQAAYMASKGRRYRDTTADFNFRLEEEIGRLHGELSAKTYRHGKYRLFTIYDPKRREIAAAPFRDRVLHHAVHDCLEPIIDRTFIHDSYACRKDKGTHKALDRAQKFLRANNFCFHGDIRKYFPSIGHNILKEILRKRIDDRDLLWLLDEIVDSAVSLLCPIRVIARKPPKAADEAISEITSCFAYARSRHDGPKGLPIGNLTSQFFANLYLNELDYFIKFDLRIKYYLRYMDDFLIFSNDKKALFEIKEKVRDFLKNRLTLDMHQGKSQVYNTGNGIKFLGFRIFKDYRRLVSDNVRRFKKRLKKFEYALENNKLSNRNVRDSVRCWAAHSRYANANTLRLNIWKGLTRERNRLSMLLKDILVGSVINCGEKEGQMPF